MQSVILSTYLITGNSLAQQVLVQYKVNGQPCPPLSVLSKVAKHGYLKKRQKQLFKLTTCSEQQGSKWNQSRNKIYIYQSRNKINNIQFKGSLKYLNVELVSYTKSNKYGTFLDKRVESIHHYCGDTREQVIIVLVRGRVNKMVV